MENTKKDIFEKVVSLCKRRGFVYPGSEIYGGLANTYDYGPLGVELNNSIKRIWWERFVRSREDIYGIDGGIILSPKVWEASGHVKNFVDPLVECKKCHKRFRKDFLDQENQKVCPECGGPLTEPKLFNTMFKTNVGPVENTSSTAYLRPETAQAIFINFKNVLDSFSPRIPFGIAQIGKAFRNEITAGNFIHRSIEFEQMEIEFFIRKEDWLETFNTWLSDMLEYATDLGIKKGNLRVREHQPDERAHYSRKTVDIEYKYYFGWKELYGLAYRSDFDLKNHAKYSGQKLVYKDPDTGEEFVPHVIEPSMGVSRTFLTVLLDSYCEDKGRAVLKLNPQLSPYKLAIFPLVKNREDIVDRARAVFDNLKTKFSIAWDARGNIGKRYYSQDEIGTPWCATIDYQTLKDDTVTIRDRDSKKQERMNISKIEQFLNNNLTN